MDASTAAGGSLTGFLFGDGGGSGIVSGFIPLAGDGGSEQLAGITNPEPASMLLVGGGMMAMAYFRSRRNRSSK